MSKFDLMAKTGEPPQRQNHSFESQPRFAISRGKRGGWIVNDKLGLIGGIFISEAAARHFVFEESGCRAEPSCDAIVHGTIKADFRRVS